MSRRVTKVVVPSATMVSETQRLLGMTEDQLADEYLSHPSLPYNQDVVIDKIGVVNFNPLSGQAQGLLRYGAFKRKRPDLFPECNDPNMDFEDEEQVSPVVIISGDTKYRVDQLLWFPLSDVVRDITARQAMMGRKLLPLKVFVDERNQWMVPLMNLSKGLIEPQQ